MISHPYNEALLLIHNLVFYNKFPDLGIHFLRLSRHTANLLSKMLVPKKLTRQQSKSVTICPHPSQPWVMPGISKCVDSLVQTTAYQEINYGVEVLLTLGWKELSGPKSSKETGTPRVREAGSGWWAWLGWGKVLGQPHEEGTRATVPGRCWAAPSPWEACVCLSALFFFLPNRYLYTTYSVQSSVPSAIGTEQQQPSHGEMTCSNNSRVIRPWGVISSARRMRRETPRGWCVREGFRIDTADIYRGFTVCLAVF